MRSGYQLAIRAPVPTPNRLRRIEAGAVNEGLGWGGIGHCASSPRSRGDVDFDEQRLDSAAEHVHLASTKLRRVRPRSRSASATERAAATALGLSPCRHNDCGVILST